MTIRPAAPWPTPRWSAPSATQPTRPSVRVLQDDAPTGQHCAIDAEPVCRLVEQGRMATTLTRRPARLAGRRRPSQVSNSDDCSFSTTFSRKSRGVTMGSGAKPVISAAEHSSPYPATASRMPSDQAAVTRVPGQPDRGGPPAGVIDRGSGMSPVAMTGASSKKPEKAPDSGQKRCTPRRAAARQTGP